MQSSRQSARAGLMLTDGQQAAGIRTAAAAAVEETCRSLRLPQTSLSLVSPCVPLHGHAVGVDSPAGSHAAI